MWTGFPFSLNKMQTGVDGISWNVWSVMGWGSIQLTLPPLVYMDLHDPAIYFSTHVSPPTLTYFVRQKNAVCSPNLFIILLVM